MKKDKGVTLVKPVAIIVTWLLIIIIGGALLAEYLPAVHEWAWERFREGCEPGVIYNVIPDPYSPTLLAFYIWIIIAFPIYLLSKSSKDEEKEEK